MRKLIALGIVVFFSVCAFAGDDYQQYARNYDYDRNAPLEARNLNLKEQSNGVKTYDFDYASLQGGRVPAYLVVPDGNGPFAAVVWGHWMKDGSPYKNRTEFLEEAQVLAKAGVVSLLIDTPMVRPDFKPDPNPLTPQDAMVVQQMVIDVRRGIDLLASRNDVDPKRIAFVGHSFDGGVAGILSGVEPRLTAIVDMAGGLSDMDWFNSPAAEKWKKKVGADNARKFLEDYTWTDPKHFVSHRGHAALLLQYATHDEFITDKDAEGYLKFIPEPRELKVYDADHALNGQARKDRVDWLREKLKFGAVDEAALAKVTQIH
jgi:cephalosporin-C deacetylase-like acetyl esterase